MLLPLHQVFLTFLLVALAWNLTVTRRGAPGMRLRWERWALVPLQVVLTVVLVRDRAAFGAPAWLQMPAIAHLFPLLFALAVVQNVGAIRERGPRLTDIPILLFNVGVGAAILLADLTLAGVVLGPSEAVLLHDHSVLQLLLGTRLADGWTLCWHLPLLLSRARERTLIGLVGTLLVASLAAFGPLVLVLLHPASRTVIASFDAEPRLGSLRQGLDLGVWDRPDLEQPGGVPPGTLTAWVLPADHSGEGLPAPRGPLVLALVPPTSWNLTLPAVDERLAVFLDGAERLARRLQPAVLLPFPEPDGQAQLTWLHRVPLTPERWTELHREARRRIRAVSPDTRVGARLAGDVSAGDLGSRWSRELAGRLAADPTAVDVLGPRLAPGGSERGGAQLAHAVLDGWRALLAERDAPPELWVLAAGASPLSYGERAQARFVEGCLARAQAAPEVAAVLIDGWHDAGHTRGLLRADGSPRQAAAQLAGLDRESPTDPPDR